jgi:hypothetical protein
MKWYLWIAFVSSCTNVFANERIVLAPGGTTLVQCPKVEHVALGNEQVISVKETLPGQLLLSARRPCCGVCEVRINSALMLSYQAWRKGFPPSI